LPYSKIKINTQLPILGLLQYTDDKELFSRISHQSSLLWMPVKKIFRSHTPRAKLEMGKRLTKKTVSLKLKTSIKKERSVKTTRSPRIACNTYVDSEPVQEKSKFKDRVG
jgi:hypothetical protein